MTTDDRKQISLHPETFEELKEQKPQGVTWDRYLKEGMGLVDE